MPEISCIIPTFNRAGLLKEAIESTVHQSFSDWELIVVDDGSSDDTEEVARGYIKTDLRIKYFINPGKGGASARNFGISKARGEYIAFLDDDDINLPHRFATQLQAARKSGNRFIVSGYEIRDRSTNRLKSTVRLELKGQGAGFPSRWLIKKELLEKVNGFDEDFPSMQDIELSYRLAEHEPFILHDDVVTVIYPTINSVSTRTENSIRGKVLLMERLGSKMIAAEAARWYFIIAAGYFNLGEKKSAFRFFKKAIHTDNNFRFKAGYYLAFCFSNFGIFTKRIILKVLHFIIHYSTPSLVTHSIVR